MHLILLISLGAKCANFSVKYFLDLTKINDRRASVLVEVQNNSYDSLLFSFPRVVPGSYKIYDFGRFVSDVTSLDAEGKALFVDSLNYSEYLLKDAKKVSRITYDVQDTWHSDTLNFVFEPCGTNFQKDTNYLINHHAVFGFFQHLKPEIITLEIKKPKGFYASTGMNASYSNDTIDRFFIKGYQELVDSPIMYCKPDTTSFEIGGANILFSVFSQNKSVTSKQLAQEIKPILLAAKDYLGGSLPVDKYAFIVYLYDGLSSSGSAGALEHGHSSVYYLPEGDSHKLVKSIRDVGAHEFYHIITPLNIHSKEISNFDFIQPKMSKHLWLYEGVTEYTAHYVQLRQDIISEKEFFNRIQSKIRNSKRYFNDTLPFTVMSKYVLTTHRNQFHNVYEKGALIGFCLDVLIRENSEGKVGLQDLINKLMEKYPTGSSFHDDELFQVIEAFTNPEISSFLENYVDGNKPIPYENIFQKIGYLYQDKLETSNFSFGSLRLVVNPTNKRLIVSDTDGMDDFGKKLGFQTGDEIVSINGKTVTAESFMHIKSEWISKVKELDPFRVLVLRQNSKGKTSRKILKTNATKVKLVYENLLSKSNNPTKQQLDLFAVWKTGNM